MCSCLSHWPDFDAVHNVRGLLAIKKIWKVPLLNKIYVLFHSSSSQGSSAEQLDELSVVGHPDEPEPSALFESSGVFAVFFIICFLNTSGIWLCSNIICLVRAMRTNRIHYVLSVYLTINLYLFQAGLLLIIRRYYSVYRAIGMCHVFMLAGW